MGTALVGIIGLTMAAVVSFRARDGDEGLGGGGVGTTRCTVVAVVPLYDKLWSQMCAFYFSEGCWHWVGIAHKIEYRSEEEPSTAPERLAVSYCHTSGILR